MERDLALGNLERLADFRSRLAARREDQPVARRVLENAVPSPVGLSRRPKPVDPPPREARGRVVDGARDELAIGERREDMASRCGAAASEREACEAPLSPRPVDGAGNPRYQSEFARLGEGLAVAHRDRFPGQRGDFLQSETAQRTGQEVPSAIGAVSVPANRAIIESDFMNRPARLGETAAEHEVTEAKLLGDE